MNTFYEIIAQGTQGISYLKEILNQNRIYNAEHLIQSRGNQYSISFYINNIDLDSLINVSGNPMYHELKVIVNRNRFSNGYPDITQVHVEKGEQHFVYSVKSFPKWTYPTPKLTPEKV